MSARKTTARSQSKMVSGRIGERFVAVVAETIHDIEGNMIVCPKSRAYSLFNSIGKGNRPEFDNAKLIEIHGDGSTKILQYA